MSEREQLEKGFEYLTKSGSLGIYPDGRIRVVWGKSVRIKSDLLCAIDEHLRPIQRSTGVVVEHEGQKFVAGGELEVITEAATGVVKGLAKSVQGEAGPLELAEALDHGRRVMGKKPRDPNKVAAKSVANAGLEQRSAYALQVASSQFVRRSYARAADITEMNPAVLARTRILVSILDRGKVPFVRLSQKAGAALDEFRRATAEGRQPHHTQVEFWIDSLLNPSSALFSLVKVKGNPFQEVATRPELVKLHDIQSVYDSEGSEGVYRVWFNAKSVLENVLKVWARPDLDPFRPTRNEQNSTRSF